MQDKVVLGYWPIRGRAQPSILQSPYYHYYQIPYENKLYTSKEEWFQGDKISPPFKDNCLVNLPYLRDGNKLIFESDAIPVYLAHKANRVDLFGKGVDGSVYFKQTKALAEDLAKSFAQNVFFAPKDQFQVDGGKSNFNNNCVPILKKVDAFLAGRRFSTGKEVALVDFGLFEIEDMVRCFDEETFNSFPNVVNHFNNVAAIPEIKAYRESNRFQERPFLPPSYVNWG